MQSFVPFLRIVKQSRLVTVPRQIREKYQFSGAICAYMSAMEEPRAQEVLSRNPVNELYKTARSMVPLEIDDSYSSSHVQTLLILGLLHYSLSDYRVARTLVGKAILVANSIDIDETSNCKEETTSPYLAGMFCS